LIRFSLSEKRERRQRGGVQNSRGKGKRHSFWVVNSWEEGVTRTLSRASGSVHRENVKGLGVEISKRKNTRGEDLNAIPEGVLWAKNRGVGRELPL